MSLDRRTLLTGLAIVSLASLGPSLSFASGPVDRKFVLVILRGAMDGLAAVPPYGDPNYAALRGQLALPMESVLPLAEGFGLHPKLAFLDACWKRKELAVLHAASSPYRDRSHFDAQDVLESGGAAVFAAQDGWLNRALTQLPPEHKAEGLAIAGTMPLVLRGPAPAATWAPSFAPQASEDAISRLMDLYADDALLGPALARAVETAAIAQDADMADRKPGAGAGRYGPGAYRALAEAAARLLNAPNGPATAVLSFDGWDTHANQGAENGQLALRLAGLDGALAALRTGLGEAWSRTVVVVATEFGRTVAENGTRGTDHGTGGVAFVLGGAVQGGRLLGDWPTLAPAALYQNRDLAPANDLRGLFASVLEQHWGLEPAVISSRVFPGGATLRREPRLIRA